MPGIGQSLFRLFFGSRMKRFDGIPGPTPSFPLGTLGEFRGKNPWDVVSDYGKTYGGMTLIWMGGQPTLVLNDPEMIRDVQITKFEDYYKDYPIKALKPVLKDTLFNLNPPKWTELWKPRSHPLLIEGYEDWLKSQFPLIQRVVEGHLEEKLASKKHIDLIDWTQRIFFDIHNKIVCGEDFEDGGFEHFYDISVMATWRMKWPPALLIPPLRPSFHRSMRRHYGAYEKALKKAKENPNPEGNDLLSIFLRQGVEIPDKQVVDFLSEFHAGGNISAAAGVVNTLHLLNEYPAVGKELYTQLIEMNKGGDGFDLAAMDRVPLLDHVLRESLRMIPPVGVWGRSVKKDRKTILGGRELPPNTPVLICTKTVQRSADHWEDPDTFDPDRWANGGVEANPVGSDYFFPFGRGPRMCAGSEMAILGMKTVLGVILSKAALRTSGPFKAVLHCGVVETPELLGQLIPHSKA